MVKRRLLILAVVIILISGEAFPQAEVIQITYPTYGTVIDTDTVAVTFDLAPYFTLGDSGCGDCDGYLKAYLNNIHVADVFQTGPFTLDSLVDGSYLLTLEAVDPTGASFDPVIEDTASFEVSYEENFCPPSNVVVSSEAEYSVLTLTWRDPAGEGGGAFFEDFEADDGGFTGQGDWEWGAPTSGPMAAYSGTNVWGTILSGDFNNGACDMLQTPPVFISGNAPQLSFWHWYDFGTGNFDGGNVKISTDGGTTWTIIYPVGGYTATSGSGTCSGGEDTYGGTGATADWQLAEFDLTPYIGETVIIAWHILATTVVPHPGWYIDDVTIDEAPTTRISEVTGRELIPSCGDLLRYDVYRDGILYDTADTTFYRDTTVTLGTEYCYFVKAVYLSGANEVSSVPSDTACGIPELFTPPPPTNLSGVGLDEEVFLSWTPPGTPSFVFFEDFTNGIPVSWTVLDGGSSTDTWMSPDPGHSWWTAFGDNLYGICDSDAADPSAILEEDLITPVLNFSSVSTPFLQFASYYNDISNGDSAEVAQVDVSVDGGSTWTNVLTWDEDHGSTSIPEIAVVDLTTVAGGHENVKIRFHYADGGLWAWYWAIDDITIWDSAPTMARQNEGDFQFYRVYQDGNLVADSVLTTSYMVTGLTNGQSYEFGVTAAYYPDFESDTITVSVAPTWLYGDISGVVTDPLGTPLDSAIVVAGTVADTTDSSGTYFLGNLEPGEYTVTVSRENFENDEALVTVVAQEAPVTQDFSLIPHVGRPIRLEATGGDFSVFLNWRTPGGESEYEVAYYDDFFESQIGCGGGCEFGVRYTPPDYPATLLLVTVYTQGDASVASGNLVAYLDPSGSVAGPDGLTSVVLATGLNLPADNAGLTQYIIDVSDAGLEITSGDIYLMIEENSSGFMGIANDIDPQSPEFYDRNWVYSGGVYSTIYDAVGGDPSLTGDFGMAATFFGVPAGRTTTVTSTGQVITGSPTEQSIQVGLFSTVNTTNIEPKMGVNPLNVTTYFGGMYTSRTSTADSLVGYNIYEVTTGGDTLVGTIVGNDTTYTVSVPANYVEYCYNVRALWETPLYGQLESKPSNIACATPFLPGDVNFDNTVDISDLSAVVDFVLGVTVPTDPQFRNADVNYDGTLNIADIVMIVDFIVTTGQARETAFDASAILDVELSSLGDSQLGLALEYSSHLRGIQVTFNYDPKQVKLGSPVFANPQEGLMVTSHADEQGTFTLLVLNRKGNVLSLENDWDITIPITLIGKYDQQVAVQLKAVQAVGPEGVQIPVVTRSKEVSFKLIPTQFALHQNYPNPFNPVTEITFALPIESEVELVVYNLRGQEVRRLVSGALEAGFHHVTWDGRNDSGREVSTGIYLYQLTAKGFQATRKMVIVK
ncbi:MAG: FlgD immunoglobulin-like domain containing protein [Fidelibacterota bacterium]